MFGYGSERLLRRYLATVAPRDLRRDSSQPLLKVLRLRVVPVAFCSERVKLSLQVGECQDGPCAHWSAFMLYHSLASRSVRSPVRTMSARSDASSRSMLSRRASFVLFMNIKLTRNSPARNNYFRVACRFRVIAQLLRVSAHGSPALARMLAQ